MNLRGKGFVKVRNKKNILLRIGICLITIITASLFYFFHFKKSQTKPIEVIEPKVYLHSTGHISNYPDRKPGEIYPISYPAGDPNARAIQNLGDKVKLKGGIHIGEALPVTNESVINPQPGAGIYNNYGRATSPQSSAPPNRPPDIPRINE